MNDRRPEAQPESADVGLLDALDILRKADDANMAACLIPVEVRALRAFLAAHPEPEQGQRIEGWADDEESDFWRLWTYLDATDEEIRKMGYRRATLIIHEQAKP